MGNINNQKKNFDFKNEEKLKNIKPINLIEAVKSKYNTKEIFSYLGQFLKLKLIKYNKKYQNLFGINIENYKKVSKKIRIMSKKGFCKEYTIDGNKLIFEGEYKNCKKNGKAKEYYESGEISFIGTYLNGKRHGKGIEYHYNGKIKFKGEYSNGYKIEGKLYNYYDRLYFELTRNGQGKEYNDYGKLIFEGQFKNEMRNGKGKEYYENGELKIEGEYKDDLLNGNVKEYNNKGKLIFDGEYKNGNKWKGKADEEDEYFNVLSTGYFKGEYLEGKKWNGKAKEYKKIFDDRPGRFSSKNILIFEGEYINGKRKGKGEKYHDKTGRIYKVKFDGENDDENNDDYEDNNNNNDIV